MINELSNITFSEVCNALEGAQNVLILTHMRPDADTLGSALALSELLTALDKKAYIVNSDSTIPKRLQFLYGKESITLSDLPSDFIPEFIVSVDVSASKLLGELEEKYAKDTDLALDHHASGTPFAKKTYVGNVGAMGEIMADIYEEFEVRRGICLTEKAASALYAAICSDTGSFKFDSVTEHTHRRAAKLLSTGINHAEIARRLYDSHPISQVMANKVALNNLHFYDNNRIAVINFTNEMMKSENLTREDIDDIINLTRSIEGVEIGVSIKQNDEDLTLFKISLRSNRVVDVSKICGVFGGGGHKRASGATINAKDEFEAEKLLIDQIEKELKELDKAHAFDNID